jgi:cytochrome c peroxidase
LVLGLWSVVTTGVQGCSDNRAFNDEQRAVLEGFRLPPEPAPDPSNKFADDVRAAILGKKWFFDPRLSGPLGTDNDGVSNGSLGAPGDRGKIACVSCHDPRLGGSDHRSRPAATSLGANYSGRNAQSVLNAAYIDLARGAWQTWDGRGDSLWGGNLLPLERPTSNNATRLQLAHVVFDHYKADYEALFGPLPALSDNARFPADGMPGDAGWGAMAAGDRDAVNLVFANIGKAIAAYERRLVSTGFAPSAFDQMLSGDDEAMTPAAIRGARLFIGKAACDDCHRGAAFADQLFHNIGVPQQGEHAFPVDIGRSDAIGLVKDSIFNRAGVFSDAPDDAHLRNLAERPADMGAFKTPTLRNVAKTAPYMHDGVYGTLGEVVMHYNLGGSTGNYAGTREVTISPLLLDSDEVSDLVEFLRALDDGDPLPTPDFPEGLVAPPALPD